MRLRRRARVAKKENDLEYLIESQIQQENSKAREILWKFAKGTWKVLKIGFQTTVTSYSYAFALEPTAVAITIVECQNKRREYR